MAPWHVSSYITFANSSNAPFSPYTTEFAEAANDVQVPVQATVGYYLEINHIANRKLKGTRVPW